MKRSKTITPTVLYLDGLTGTGKTMMGPLLGSFARVELGRFDHIHEHLCALDALKKIEPDAASFILSMYTDLGLYNIMIARETNFRFHDLSGAFSNPNFLRYFIRLFRADGNRVIERINQENPIYQVISHQALPVMELVFRTHQNRAKVVEMVRHPFYLIEHWETYIHRHGEDPRDFTVWVDYNGKSLPWFARGWEETYVNLSNFDKCVYTIAHLTKLADKTTESLPEDLRKNVLTIPFEHFVLDPEPYLKQIEALLDSSVTATTRRILKAQKVPRRQVALGPNKEIYKKYAWKKPKAGQTDKDHYEEKREFLRTKVSPAAFAELEKIAHDYESRYGLWF